ncbi:hypothetical protein EON67_02925 [archaeon]|nr:MAG: hypothetical protein EON67_02925 [archaeon]
MQLQNKARNGGQASERPKVTKLRSYKMLAAACTHTHTRIRTHAHASVRVRSRGGTRMFTAAVLPHHVRALLLPCCWHQERWQRAGERNVHAMRAQHRSPDWSRLSRTRAGGRIGEQHALWLLLDPGVSPPLATVSYANGIGDRSRPRCAAQVSPP